MVWYGMVWYCMVWYGITSDTVLYSVACRKQVSACCLTCMDQSKFNSPLPHRRIICPSLPHQVPHRRIYRIGATSKKTTCFLERNSSHMYCCCSCMHLLAARVHLDSKVLTRPRLKALIYMLCSSCAKNARKLM